MDATTPKKPPLHNQVTSERLYALGIELMDHAAAQSDAAGRTSKAHAIAYRDGLLIALMAVIAGRPALARNRVRGRPRLAYSKKSNDS
jgi:hypothetical protein